MFGLPPQERLDAAASVRYPGNQEYTSPVRFGHSAGGVRAVNTPKATAPNGTTPMTGSSSASASAYTQDHGFGSFVPPRKGPKYVRSEALPYTASPPTGTKMGGMAWTGASAGSGGSVGREAMHRSEPRPLAPISFTYSTVVKGTVAAKGMGEPELPSKLAQGSAAALLFSDYSSKGMSCCLMYLVRQCVAK
jgi:hypothetical protein